MSGNQENNEGSKVAKIVSAAMGLAAFVGCVASLLSAGSETTADRKMMKAPGKHGEHMYRGDFERDPSKYFKDLRKK